MRIVDPISYFAGEWTYERDLSDRGQSVRGEASGTATFTVEDGRLLWRESGLLEIGPARTPATRALTIEPSESGWTVRFDDGRLFHRLDLAEGRCEVDHPCGDDLYQGRIEAASEDSFRTAWRVRGPRKDQSIETVYRRVGAGV